MLQRGRRTTARAFVVFGLSDAVLLAQARGSRLGITMSRKVGNAVARNRVKRRIREWFRHQRSGLDPRLALVVIGRPGAAVLTSAEISALLDDATKRLAKDVS